MPIEDFTGNTFVAFTDISGFKELMKNDAIALEAIRYFYQAGFDILNDATNVEGFFVSDCGVLFARNGSDEKKLFDLLSSVKQINKKNVIKELFTK